MATTTSTEDSGLLEIILPAFERRHGYRVRSIATGTGKAIRHGENGDVDVVFVHARRLEDKFVSSGHGIGRRDVMYNDFIIAGPPADPAGIRGMKTAAAALSRISATEALFVSRGDESGTHQKERELWKAANVTPAGKWYMEAGQGMGECLTMASEKGAYLLADRGTWLRRRKGLALAVLVEGDRTLFNPYGIIAVNPALHPRVDHVGARKLIDFLVSREGQRLIGGYKVDGEPLFHPSAGKSR